MPKFSVTVQKEQAVSGTIEVEAEDATKAVALVDSMMRDTEKPLQTIDARIKWNAPEYQDDSFSTTGETERVEEEPEEPMLVIQYQCPKCQHEWEERWTSACDSECPECGTTDIQALDWEEAGDETE